MRDVAMDAICKIGNGNDKVKLLEKLGGHFRNHCKE
jgi:hypothetical protein